MIRAIAITCAALVASCVPNDEPAFEDKGRGTWVEMEGAPELAYRAIWATDANKVYAVGGAGVALYDGASWRVVGDIPRTAYRAVWGRSPSQVWVGGDDALLVRTLTGWQPQVLRDGDTALEHYSVLALGGDELHEYALVTTGGKVLLFVNYGSAWETPFWRGANGPTALLPQTPSLLVRDWSLLVAGDGELIECEARQDFGFDVWEAADAVRSHSWTRLPMMRAITGGPGFWAGAGGDSIVMKRDGDPEPEIRPFTGRALVARDARAIFAASANRLFVVGDPVILSDADVVSGVSTSPVEACDDDGCALERMLPVTRIAPLRAVWGTDDGAVFAVSDGSVFRRWSK